MLFRSMTFWRGDDPPHPTHLPRRDTKISGAIDEYAIHSGHSKSFFVQADKFGWDNKEFVAKRTENLDELRAKVAKYDFDRVEQQTGITRERIIEAARLYSHADKAMIVYGHRDPITGKPEDKSCAVRVSKA